MERNGKKTLSVPNSHSSTRFFFFFKIQASFTGQVLCLSGLRRLFLVPRFPLSGKPAQEKSYFHPSLFNFPFMQIYDQRRESRSTSFRPNLLSFSGNFELDWKKIIIKVRESSPSAVIGYTHQVSLSKGSAVWWTAELCSGILMTFLKPPTPTPTPTILAGARMIATVKGIKKRAGVRAT